MIHEERVPGRAAIASWIEAIYARGIRRPGTPADRWTEQFCAERLREEGLERVRLEPLPLPSWEPRAWELRIESGAESFTLPCFPLPHAAATEGLDVELAAFDPLRPESVRGRASLCDVTLLRVPPDFAAQGRVYDPGGSFVDALQVLPFGAEIQNVMEPSLAAGAACFIGVLTGYPGDSCDYYVPYDGLERAIPGVWIRGSDGPRLRALLARGAVRVRLQVDALRETITSHNVVGELPGADEDLVVIGSHHDGPWASAVEDASGVALVLAQARYWSGVPRAERPHRLVFLLNAGHMAGGAGCQAFLDAHVGELERIVLELHLEHAAREVVERDGELVTTDRPEPRWWFTSRIPLLEEAVAKAIEAEGLERSLILAPDALAPHPTTDGGFFHTHGVPLVNYLCAPFYLFDRMDTLDKIHEPSLEAVSRAAIRIIAATRGVSAAELRAAATPGP